jgi:hypothetical protein
MILSVASAIDASPAAASAIAFAGPFFEWFGLCAEPRNRPPMGQLEMPAIESPETSE